MATDVRVQHEKTLEADAAFEEFRRRGYVLFPRVLPRELIEQMYAVWAEYFAVFSGRRPQAPRLIMFTPFKPPLYDPRFVEHPLVLRIVDRALGPDCVAGYFASETPLPGAPVQKLHFDIQCFNRWAPLNRPLSFMNKLLGSLHYCYAIQVTVPLVDSREDNAPLEVWPGTHRFARQHEPPERLLMPAGSMLVRDLRNLHRGTPHHGTSPRPFLSIAYVRTWAPKWRQPEIPRDVYDALPERSRRLFRLAKIGQPVPDPEAWAL
jgi:Phytanoyl-CoA dioxygenase (PhyH)